MPGRHTGFVLGVAGGVSVAGVGAVLHGRDLWPAQAGTGAGGARYAARRAARFPTISGKSSETVGSHRKP